MGLRKILSRGVSGGLTALGVVLAATGAHAQETAPPTNQSTPAPTPTPTPGSIGNPTLENFDLNGTVTRTPTPAPSPTPAPVRATPAPAPTSTAPAPTTSAPDAPAPQRTAPAPSVAAPTASTPDTSVALPLPQASPLPSTTTGTDLMPPTAPTPQGGSIWPWLAALAVALAAAAAWWLRRQKTTGEEMAYAGYAPVAETPAAMPPARPAPHPRAATPPSDGITTRVPGPAGLNDGIVSRTLLPKLSFELVPLKFETDDKQNVRLTFELVVVNVGSAPARDIRIEAKMFNAGPEQDRQIVQFFQTPGELGAKLPPIAPRDRVPLRSRIGMPVGQYQALTMGGKPLVIPMVAVNAVYRGSGGETQDSASWLVGANPAGGEAEKLKPFPLDRPIAATALAARMHSAGIQARA